MKLIFLLALSAVMLEASHIDYVDRVQSKYELSNNQADQLWLRGYYTSNGRKIYINPYKY